MSLFIIISYYAYEILSRVIDSDPKWTNPQMECEAWCRNFWRVNMARDPQAQWILMYNNICMEDPDPFLCNGHKIDEMRKYTHGGISGNHDCECYECQRDQYRTTERRIKWEAKRQALMECSKMGKKKAYARFTELVEQGIAYPHEEGTIPHSWMAQQEIEAGSHGAMEDYDLWKYEYDEHGKRNGLIFMPDQYLGWTNSGEPTAAQERQAMSMIDSITRAKRPPTHREMDQLGSLLCGTMTRECYREQLEAYESYCVDIARNAHTCEPPVS